VNDVMLLVFYLQVAGADLITLHSPQHNGLRKPFLLSGFFQPQGLPHFPAPQTLSPISNHCNVLTTFSLQVGLQNVDSHFNYMTFSFFCLFLLPY
jgi:hypothetical protein